MSMKNSNDTIGNRNRDLPVCSAVPQSTAAPCAAGLQYILFYGIPFTTIVIDAHIMIFVLKF